MANCLAKKIKGVFDNSGLSTLYAVTFHIDAAAKERLVVLDKGEGITVSCTNGNNLSLSSDGSNPTNHIDIEPWAQTTVYFLPGKYNVIVKRITDLDVIKMYSDASNNSSITFDDYNNCTNVTELTIENAKVKGEIGILSNLNKIVFVSLLNIGYELTGSVEYLCKNIIEKGQRRTSDGLRFEADNHSELYIMDSVKFPGPRNVNVSFDLTNHSFTMTESSLGINRTYTLSGGTWSYVDN